MSRRPNPAADRAEQNRATLKNLVKLEGNKTCSDCKRNKRAYCWSTYMQSADNRLRPAMGKLEPGCLYMHSLLWHTPWNGYAHQ
jgi:hypothetical protein